MSPRMRAPIMVAIAEVGRTSLPLLQKAAALARQRDASLQLVHVIALPYGPVVRAGNGVRSAFKRSMEESREALDELTRLPALRGLEIKTTVAWDYPASDAIVRQVLKQRPALLIAASQRHARLARVLLTNTDWDLIRNCPCPLLLSKTRRMPARPTVVAALDPFHAHAKPAGLDTLILEAAVAAAGSPQRVRAFHAHEMPRLPIDGALEPYWVTMSDLDLAAYEGGVRKALATVAARSDIPEKNVVYERGDPASRLPRFAKRCRADVVVMGAVSRSGLTRLFIGNTAERVIDKLDCDVLIVKPRRFATPVQRRPPRLPPSPPYPLTM